MEVTPALVKLIRDAIGDIYRWRPEVLVSGDDFIHLEEYIISVEKGTGVWALEQIHTVVSDDNLTPPEHSYQLLETADNPFTLIRVALKRLLSERVDNVVEGLTLELQSGHAPPGPAPAPGPAPGERPNAPQCVGIRPGPAPRPGPKAVIAEGLEPVATTCTFCGSRNTESDGRRPPERRCWDCGRRWFP